MSRCFPFPPPGYDKKLPFDYENLLRKEKKEKKHKKDKKDKRDKKEKEKKDKKEKDRKEKRDKKDKKRKHKKDKERSEGKQREEKDSTEEQRDNNEHVETHVNNGLVENGKHREKEQNQTSIENDTVGPLKYNSFKNLGSNCMQRDDASEFKFLLDSRKRTRDDIKVKERPSIQKINLSGKRDSEVGNVLKDKRDADGMVCGQSKGFVARSNNNYSLPSYIGSDERKVARVHGFVDKRITELKENGMHKNVDIKKDGHKDPNREEKSKSKGEIGEDKANVMVPDRKQYKTKENSQNALCFDNGKPSPLSKADNKAFNLGKRKALEMNDILLHEKESQPNKLPRFLPPSNHVSERGRYSEPCMTPTQSISKFAEKVQNHKVSSKFSYNGSKLEATQASIHLEKQENCADYNLNNDILYSHPVVQNDVGALNMCYSSKQFDFERLQSSNGQNMDGKISLCHPVVRNKVVVEAVTDLSSRGDVMIDDQKLNHNDLKINGLEENKKSNVSTTRPSSKIVKKNGGTSAKPPHPDSKYLSEILTIPSVEWPDMDNQEWLFSGRNNQHSKKSTSGSSRVAETTVQVWSKALQIESADVTALPYVLPY